MTAIPPDRSEGSLRALGARALLVLLAAGALLWGVTHVRQRTWPPPPDVPVALAGEHYRVAPAELRWLETFSAQHFSEGEQSSRRIVEAEIDARLDRLFGEAKGRLPAFADWYYSLPGEYTRAGVAALSAVGLAAPGYVARHAASTLFPDDVWTDSLTRLEGEADARLAAHESDVRASWLAEVTRRLADYRVPAPLPGTRPAGGTPVDLDALVRTIVAREQGALTMRLSLSTLAAGGAALGPVLWRAMATRGGEAAGARAAAERLAARGVARAGSAAAGAAALCSPGGPLAFGCAAAAGAAAWFGTDWALLEIDERLHRPELLRELDAGLTELRTRTKRELLGAYDAVISGRYDAVQDDIKRGFVPADAGAGT